MWKILINGKLHIRVETFTEVFDVDISTLDLTKTIYMHARGTIFKINDVTYTKTLYPSQLWSKLNIYKNTFQDQLDFSQCKPIQIVHENTVKTHYAVSWPLQVDGETYYCSSNITSKSINADIMMHGGITSRQLSTPIISKPLDTTNHKSPLIYTNPTDDKKLSLLSKLYPEHFSHNPIETVRETFTTPANTTGGDIVSKELNEFFDLNKNGYLFINPFTTFLYTKKLVFLNQFNKKPKFVYTFPHNLGKEYIKQYPEDVFFKEWYAAHHESVVGLASSLGIINPTNQELKFISLLVFRGVHEPDHIGFVFEQDDITIFNKLAIILYDSYN